MKAEPALPFELACRNLWNLYSLDHHDKELFDKFAVLIAKNHDQLMEIDVANALRAFSHFHHTDSEAAASCLESLVKVTIRQANSWRL